MLLLEVQDIPSHAEIYTLRTAKVIENHIKHVVRGVYRGSGSVSLDPFVSQLFCFRALKLGLDAVARRLWCVRAIKSEFFFCFFSTSHFVLFKSEFVFCHVIRGTRRYTKQNANGTVDHD